MSGRRSARTSSSGSSARRQRAATGAEPLGAERVGATASRPVRALAEQPNVTLRPAADGQGQEVVLAFPYDGHLVAAVRTLPGRRFDWDRREWSAPADGWVAAKLAVILDARPELRRSAEFDAWLAQAERRFVGYVRTAVHDGRGWFALDALAGEPPAELREGALEQHAGAVAAE